MMKFALAISACIAATPSLAASPPTWQGVVQVLPAKNQCEYPAPGAKMPSIFRQSFGGSTGPSAISMLDSLNKMYLFSVTASDQKFAAKGTLAEKVISNWGTFYEVSGITYAFSYDPPLAEITAATPFVNLTGSLTDFGGRSACIVKFHAGYAKVVE